jgi:hypothetical protein
MLPLLRAFMAGNVLADESVDAGRRDLLSRTPAALLLGSGALVAPPQADAANKTSNGFDPIDSSFIEFPDEMSRFRAHMRFERNLRDQAEVTSWYHFTQYLVTPGFRPTPIIRFEGLEYSYLRRIGRETWRVHGHNMSFPRDLRTGQMSDAATNPVTGDILKVEPMFLTGDPGMLHSPRGFLTLDRLQPQWVAPNLMFRREGELVKMEQIRPAPESWPKMFVESSSSFVPRREFDNARITSLLYQTSGFYIFPCPKWMNMGDRPGHMLGFWSGRKLRGAHELPMEFRARAQRDRPDLLEARWEIFEKPIPEALRTAVI